MNDDNASLPQVPRRGIEGQFRDQAELSDGMRRIVDKLRRLFDDKSEMWVAKASVTFKPMVAWTFVASSSGQLLLQGIAECDVTGKKRFMTAYPLAAKSVDGRTLCLCAATSGHVGYALDDHESFCSIAQDYDESVQSGNALLHVDALS